MKLTFSWHAPFVDRLEPRAESDARNEEGLDLVSNVLMDTGGLAYLSTVPWLEEGLQRVAAVERGEAASLDWGREDFGVRFERDRATVYSHYVDSCVQSMDLSAFAAALRAWIDFIRQPADVQVTVSIDL
jgi:hypothetical protein